MPRNNVWPVDRGTKSKAMFKAAKPPAGQNAGLLPNPNRGVEAPKASKDDKGRRTAPGLKRGTSHRNG